MENIQNPYIDPVTKLPLHVLLLPQLEQNLNKNHSLGLIMLTVHGLDPIEESCGAEIFDNILHNVAKFLGEIQGSTIRKEDLLAVSCLGGTSFMVFLSEQRQDKDAHYILKENIEIIEKRIYDRVYPFLCSLFYQVTKEPPKLAIGHSIIVNNPLIRPRRLIDKLIEEAKQMTRLQLPLSRFKNKEELQRIILQEDIHTVFQPIVFLDSLEPMGFEALTRGPKGTSYLDPLTLFGIAKEVGLIFELDRLCRRKALLASKALPEETKIFINTLPTTIHDPEFRGNYLTDFLQDIKRKPENIVFEINERMAIDNFSMFRKAIEYYTNLGIAVAIDDTGTGYSSLEAIVELKPHFLKFDLSLVKGISQNPLKQEMLKMLSMLALKMNAQIIAEGIEYQEDLNVLKDLGLKLGQGYLFAKPEPVDQLLQHFCISSIKK